MKKFLILLLLALAKIVQADSQSAHTYSGWIDDDNYAITITWVAAPGTPDGEYIPQVSYDGGPPVAFTYVWVVNGVCSPASTTWGPDPAGGHGSRVLYIGVGNHTWHWQGPSVLSSTDAHLAVTDVPYTGGPGGSSVWVYGSATVTIGQHTLDPTHTRCPDLRSGGDG